VLRGTFALVAGITEVSIAIPRKEVPQKIFIIKKANGNKTRESDGNSYID
jgi:hypothetical protein